MIGWGLYAQADDSYESFVVAVYSTKRAAMKAMKTAKRRDHSHRPDYWGIREVLLDPEWDEFVAARWEFRK